LKLTGKIARLARSLTPDRASPDDDWAARFLTPAEWRVYAAMDPRDREHGERVAKRLCHDHPDAAPELIAAALLHDCGKSVRPYRVWERVAVGLVPHRASALLTVGALRVRARHPELGADMLVAAEARPRVVELVRRHHDPGRDDGAALLQRYDDLE